MPHSPLILKIRVHNPNKKGAANANRNGLHYIATREGVSLERIDTVDDLLKIEGMEEKEIRESLVHQEASDENYLRYIAKRPRSHGLFGNVNTEDLKAMEREVASLTKAGRIIYRGVISLSEQDAIDLGFRNINAWNNYLKEVIPDVAQHLGISPANHTWVAAYHAEETHPHIHFMLWDNQDKVKSPFIHKATQQKIRILLEEKMFDNEYERAMRQAINEELNPLRNKERNFLMSQTQEIMQHVFYAPGIECERLPQRVSNEYLQEISDEVEKLISMLPGKGSFKYEYMPPEVKEQLQVIVDKLLVRSDMQNAINKRMGYVARAWEGYSKTYIQSHQEQDMRDMRIRIANKVLKEVKENFQSIIQLPEEEHRAELSSVHEEHHRAELGSVPEEIIDNIEDNIYESDLEVKEEQNPVHFIGKADSSEVVYIEESEEQNSVPFYENDIQPELLSDKNEITIEDRYYVAWSSDYKQAIEAIYNEGDLQMANDVLRKEADKGNALAIHELAKLIERNLIDVPAENAIQYYNQALKAFSSVYESNAGKKYIKSYAAYRIGKLFEFGKGEIDIDYTRAEAWYKKSIGNKFAQYSLAKLYLSEKVYVTEKQDLLENQQVAINLLKSSAEAGNPFAAYELGNIYHKGISVACDEEQAGVYYQKALAKFLEMATKSTDDSLFYRIGTMYLNGQGTEQNQEEGEKYIQKAAELGNVNAKLKLSTIYLEKEDVKLREKAVEMLSELAEKDNYMAQYKLGYIYSNVEISEFYDMTKAVSYLGQSAEQGNQFAQYKLGCIYSNTEMLEFYNMTKAVDYLTQAAEQANEYARYKLGCIYSNAEISEFYDMTKAVSYLEQAAEQGNQFAQCRLGVMYYFGRGVSQDKELGKYWLEQSAEQGNQFAKDVLENPDVGIGFSYCLLKGILSAIETSNRRQVQENLVTRTQSKQAMREKLLHSDKKKEHGKGEQA